MAFPVFTPSEQVNLINKIGKGRVIASLDGFEVKVMYHHGKAIIVEICTRPNRLTTRQWVKKLLEQDDEARKPTLRYG